MDLTSPSNKTCLFLGLDGVSAFDMSRRYIKLKEYLLLFQRISMKKGCLSTVNRTGENIWHIQDFLYSENASVFGEIFTLWILPPPTEIRTQILASLAASTQACALALHTPRWMRPIQRWAWRHSCLCRVASHLAGAGGSRNCRNKFLTHRQHQWWRQ